MKLNDANVNAYKMCNCGHLWIEHNNHATLTQKEGFKTDTKECHFCKCKQFGSIK
jgi:hypothetical protein